MCGHVGVIGNLNQKHVDVFTDLLKVGLLRGEHGTGIASVSKSGSMGTLKNVGPPSGLVYDKNYSRYANQNAVVLIGHNRYATVGKHTVQNTHPFLFDNVVGAHNGTLSDYGDLPDYGNFGTDSETLISALNGAKDPADVFKDVGGAWAAVWFDRRTKTLNLLRNSERPLFLLQCEDTPVVYWASEELMLRWVFDRNFSYSKYKIIGLQENVLTQIEIPDRFPVALPLKITEKGEVVGKKVRSYGGSYRTGKGYAYGEWWGDYADSYTKPENVVTLGPELFERKPHIVTAPKGKNGVSLTALEWANANDGKCSCCAEDLPSWGDPSCASVTVIDEETSTVLCPVCSEQPDTLTLFNNYYQKRSA